MTKPLNHSNDLATLLREQLRAQYPSASGGVIEASARARAILGRSNVVNIGLRPIMEEENSECETSMT